MTKEYKYAIELIIHASESNEQRIADLLNYCEQVHKSMICQITNFEATGKIAIELERELRYNKKMVLLSDALLGILNQDGQIIELNMLFQRGDFSGRLIVRDGGDINFLSNDLTVLNQKKIGDFRYLDMSLFKVV